MEVDGRLRNAGPIIASRRLRNGRAGTVLRTVDACPNAVCPAYEGKRYLPVVNFGLFDKNSSVTARSSSPRAKVDSERRSRRQHRIEGTSVRYERLLRLSAERSCNAFTIIIISLSLRPGAPATRCCHHRHYTPTERCVALERASSTLPGNATHARTRPRQ